ncbi:calcium-binding protein [Yoonia maritima]|uniref:calcium-binding protein n=1 Tax=Yoonia maritima TaxID=1435347 RepID=UPI0037369513
MATPINPENVMDFDQPLNTDPTYTAMHVFSTDDITGTFDGLTQGDVTDGPSIIDFTADPKVTQDGVNLYPINSEFGFEVTDFDGATEKSFDDGLYEEGWAGDLVIGGEHVGLVISDAPTDTFKTPAVLGTWLAGLGGNTVKASTEHYVVMQNVLSDQHFPDDPDAVYALDDNLIMIGGEYDGEAVADLLAGNVDGVTIEDVNLDGVVDIKDILQPNESSIQYDIAASTDYSVTMKDDGKLLYRWGNTIKRPNDVRVEAEIPLPDEWNELDVYSSLKPLYKVTQAELVVHHTITNNPNDQVRPEDFENESAIGTLPTYEIDADGRWVTTDDYYAGDGTLYPAGTVLKDPALAISDTATLAQIGAASEDLLEGYTNAWYTTMNREPFEPVLNADGTEYIVGPRWRLQPDKYGQDLPSVVIPLDPSATANPTKDQVKYEVGAETQTVLNLLDWETDISPLSISAGWQNNSGTVSANGLNMTENFDVALYIKGDVKPATIYSAELVLDYEEIEMFADGASISGTDNDDFLVGIANNTFTGGAGSDLFVVSYGTTITDEITASVITDFEVGVDKIGLIGFDALAGFDIDSVEDRSLIGQTVSGDDLVISIDGEQVVTLTGTAAALDMGDTFDPGEGLSILDSFLITNPSPGVEGGEEPEINIIDGTAASETLVGTAGDDYISGLAGNDYIYALVGDDTLDGGAGLDRLYGGAGEDVFVFAEGTTLDIVYDFENDIDQIALIGLTEDEFGDVTISAYGSTGTMLLVGDDRMILRGTAVDEITIDDFIFDEPAMLA